jgi:hypothetical protein
MKVSRFAVVFAVAMTVTWGIRAQPLRAQSRGSWSSAANDTLVTRAITRRGLQLADSTLLSFEADAHGFLAFLAQLGEGRIIPPRVVQSEELMSRLYWWQPGRSAQRLVGRRDTTLLPARVGYYRDRYQVVLDNLPDLIRLGDGQDVRDVPHPLSQKASSMYEFSRGGALRIRIPGKDILVDEVRFRPLDDTQPAAVGSVYLDRETAAVVRLSMAFTRAAIIDKRIETLILTLENALISGKYWLPRRQEVEVSRRATWFEIPARGIVRGRWEVSGYTVNERIAPAATQLPRWSSVSSDSLRAFPFEGRVIDMLPPDVKMATDEEVETARAQVEAAVRAAALARPSRNAFTGRGISDFARFSRTEGLAAGLGVSRRVGSVQLSARARYGFADEQVKGQLALGLVRGLGGEPHRQFFVEREYRDVAMPERGGVTNSLAALLFGSDYTTQVDTRAVGFTQRFSKFDGQLRVAYEEDRPISLHATPISGVFEPTLAFAPTKSVRLELRNSGGSAADVGATSMRWSTLISSGAMQRTRETADKQIVVPFRLHAGLSVDRPLGNDRTLSSSTQLMFGTRAAPQWLAFAGGPLSGPGYDFHEFAGTAILSQRIEARIPIPAPSIALGKYGRSPARVTIAPFAHAVALGGATYVTPHPLSSPTTVRRFRPSAVYPAAGVGLLFFYDLIRADIARGLRDGHWRFSIDIDRAFWSVM